MTKHRPIHASTHFAYLLVPWYNRTGWLGVKHQFTYCLPDDVLQVFWTCIHHTHHNHTPTYPLKHTLFTCCLSGLQNRHPHLSTHCDHTLTHPLKHTFCLPAVLQVFKTGINTCLPTPTHPRKHTLSLPAVLQVFKTGIHSPQSLTSLVASKTDVVDDLILVVLVYA